MANIPVQNIQEILIKRLPAQFFCLGIVSSDLFNLSYAILKITYHFVILGLCSKLRCNHFRFEDFINKRLHCVFEFCLNKLAEKHRRWFAVIGIIAGYALGL